MKLSKVTENTTTKDTQPKQTICLEWDAKLQELLITGAMTRVETQSLIFKTYIKLLGFIPYPQSHKVSLEGGTYSKLSRFNGKLIPVERRRVATPETRLKLANAVDAFRNRDKLYKLACKLKTK